MSVSGNTASTTWLGFIGLLDYIANKQSILLEGRYDT